MNYSRVREAAKKKLEEKKAQLSQMSGEDRTKLEAHLVGQAEAEELQRIKKENEELKAKHEAAEKLAAKVQEENEELKKLNEEIKTSQTQDVHLDAEELKEEIKPDPAPAPAPAPAKPAYTNSHKRR